MTWPQILLPLAYPAAQVAALVLLGWVLRVDKPKRKAVHDE